MFTAQQIKEAYAKVKSGADYPGYVQELKALGVTRYDYVVESGNNVFYGDSGFSLKVENQHDRLQVAGRSSKEKLQGAISMHQQGQTDFKTFCGQAADAGVEKWVSDLEKMQVLYYDRAGTLLLSEPIPAGNY
jgi:uncharacterized protein YbcV (DUF1398 family)